MPGTLYVVATPIGNLEDITFRAARVLREVDLIAAEDTRVTRKLLSHYDIHTPLTSYHEHSRPEKIAALVRQLAEGTSIAVVSDAGMPGISDPGEALVAVALEAGIVVTPIPGASSVLSAVAASGLPTARFTFEGFPPRPAQQLRRYLRDLEHDPRTLVFFEAPGRVAKTLEAMREVWGGRRAVVARELTKRFEEIRRGTLEELATYFADEARGEMVIVVEGASGTTEKPAEGTLDTRLAAWIAEGLSEREAVRRAVAELGVPRRDAYAAALRLKGEREEE